MVRESEELCDIDRTGKRKFPTRREADTARRNLMARRRRDPRGEMETYRCGDHWHFGPRPPRKLPKARGRVYNDLHPYYPSLDETILAEEE